MDKNEKIEEIKTIMYQWGSTTATELEVDSSPCINSKGSGRNNISELVEEFDCTEVTVVTYEDELELCRENVPYKNLSEEIIDEIYEIVLKYDSDQTALYKELYGLM